MITRLLHNQNIRQSTNQSHRNQKLLIHKYWVHTLEKLPETHTEVDGAAVLANITPVLSNPCCWNKACLVFTFAFQHTSFPVKPVNCLTLAWIGLVPHWLSIPTGWAFAADLKMVETQKLSLQKVHQAGGNLTTERKEKRLDMRDDVRIPDLSTGKTGGNIGIWRQ